MTLETEQNHLLEKILKSNEFSHSTIYQTYLTYLVESSRKGKDLKETVIAMEVFGKDASFNPAEDTIVRSHTYTLRKKLESYYFHEGQDDKYRLRIPKGHYNTKFVPASTNLYHPNNWMSMVSHKVYFVLTLVLLCSLALMTAYNLILRKNLNQYHCIENNNPIWKEYLQSDLPIMIVVGDHFFFNDFIDKYQDTFSLRNAAINTMEDFRAAYPNVRVTESQEPYFPYHSIWSIPPILRILYSANKAPILRKSSDVGPQILDEYNIIFLGSIKTLYKLKHTLLKSHFQYEVAPHRVFYTKDDTSETRVFETSLHSSGPNEDLVLALKLPGPDNNSIFIIASYHSLGAPEIAQYLATTAKRRELEQKFLEKFNHIPPYFEVLFRVTGIDKTAYNTEILIYNEIIRYPHNSHDE
ncbi:hypothetical protein JW948_05545 [bacterium]|nr:hypothetical protein [bacterium]